MGTVDLGLAWRATPAATVTLFVQNLADRHPSWDSSTAFFDFTQGDPRGRFASVKLDYRF